MFTIKNQLYVNSYAPIYNLYGSIIDSMKYIYDSVIATTQFPFKKVV